VDVPEEDLDKIAHIALPLGKDAMIMATDTLESLGQSLTIGNNHYIYLETDAAAEAERLFEGLSEGGRVDMPLQGTEWAEQYGVCTDRFGVQWMIGYTGNRSSELPKQ
jgi:PhnB protein